MKNSTKEMIIISTKEILLSLVDVAVEVASTNPWYRKSLRSYEYHRNKDRKRFFERIRYLKQMGYIQEFVENKERFIELTPKGLHRLEKIKIEQVKIMRPEKWDGKWRVIIFDIPDKYRTLRDAFRKKIIELGFKKIQESVYTFPFECAKEISLISKYLDLGDSVLVLIAEIIQGEEALIASFIENKMLKKDDLIVHKT